MTKLFVRNVEQKLQEIIMRVTKTDVQLEHVILLNVSTSQHVRNVRKLISTFTLPKNIAHHKKISQLSVLSPSFCWRLFLVITQTENSQRTNGDQNCGCDTVAG